MAVIHKGVDKIQDSASPPNLVTIAELRTTVDNQANKADVGHGHNIDDLTDVEVTGAAPGQVLSFTMNLNGTGVPGWEPATISGGGGTSNVGALDDLSDVDVTTVAPADAQVLTYQSGTWTAQTLPTAATGGATTVNQLNDVNTTGASPGDLLTYSTDIDGSGTAGWAVTTPTATSTVANLDDLTDVNAATPGNNQVLAWTGSAWEPANPSTATAAVLTDAGVTFDNSSGDNEYIYGSAPQLVVNISAPQDGEGLVYQSGQWINGAVAGSGSVDLGISVTVAGGNVDYEFNSPSPQGYPSVDTSTLATGSTMMWDGSNWVNSGLIIESYT